jgi:hypothetical protein
MAAAFCSEAERLAAMEEDAKQQDAPDAIDGNDPVLRAALLETGGESKPDHDSELPLSTALLCRQRSVKQCLHPFTSSVQTGGSVSLAK